MKNKKVGLAPGTLIYTGELKDEKIKIILYSYNKETVKKVIDNSLDKLSFFNEKDFVNWIVIEGVHDVELIKKIGVFYEIDNLILEDILNINQRPKFEEREKYISFFLKMIYLNKKSDEIEYEQISFILGEGYLITFQEKTGNIFNNLQERIENGIGKLRNKKENYLMYALFDIIVDNYFLILENFEERIEVLEEKIVNNPSQKIIEEIISLKKEISKFKRNVIPIKEILIKISNIDYFDESMNIYLKDLHDHSTIIYESIEIIYNRSNDLIQLCHSSIGNSMNEIMKILTTISTIFIPLSFLAGLYGMNFKYMPELSWEYGYYFILGLMFIVVAGMILYFKRKNWW
ncbi:magnesium and cobalt transport protein CorA [Fusobacterium ulcerans]|uniref:Magnesium transport protein CorA n=1 Tax=Fusobacterium ulcerans TaxID=861 RepID=A0AAX2J897_9FUSO|nr:magnesium/cobalt transporter CorA [Fusobacterium ulcerans]AVQ28718.1 magnesium and cobalt transport protein CorA [Fusobacterium ulcerans]EFS26194.1 magnesium and cobalt transporter CorA [Fusobacterium ulcerans ATCC 49185]SQJ00613.1 Magnesium transport protein CorA [Fusobacterium ulcerans]